MLAAEKTVHKTDRELLLEYQATRDAELKNELTLKYSYIVKTIALQMRGIYTRYADVDDIVNEGIIALIGALDKFDASKNVKFESYASLRIRGSIIDFVRKQDWTPRRVKKFSKSVDRAECELYSQFSRYPTDEEMANHLGMGIDEYRRSVMETTLCNMISLDSLIYESQMQSEIKHGYGGVETLPEQGAEQNELRQVLKNAILKLSEKEQLVISLYYKNDFSFKDIASVLGVSDPRISQIHTNALRKLRMALEKYFAF